MFDNHNNEFVYNNDLAKNLFNKNKNLLFTTQKRIPHIWIVHDIKRIDHCAYIQLQVWAFVCSCYIRDNTLIKQERHYNQYYQCMSNIVCYENESYWYV